MSEITRGFLEWNVKRERWDMVSGLRSDVHDTFGVFVSPRLECALVLHRCSDGEIGRWKRLAHFCSLGGVCWCLGVEPSLGVSRCQCGDGFRGLEPEESWNMGLNLLVQVQPWVTATRASVSMAIG